MIFFAFITFMKTLGFENEGFQSKSTKTATAHEIIFSLFFRQIEIKMTKIFICEFRKDLASLYDVLSAFCVVACKDKKRDVH